MSGKVRVLSVAVVLVCLTAGSASTLPLGPQPTITPEPEGIVALWDWLVGLFDGGGLLWEKAGSDMDPDGLPKAGSDMDPNGQPKSGGDMDPKGKPGSNND